MTIGEIWAYAEQRNGVLLEASLEVVAEARQLALKMNAEVGAVLIGYRIRELTQPLVPSGASKVYIVDDPILGNYGVRPFARVITSLIANYKPSLVLFPATFLGADLAPRIAARLKCAMASNCVSVHIDELGKFVMTRPAYSGQVYANVVAQVGGPVIVTIKPGAIGLNISSQFKQAEIITVPANVGSEEVWTRVVGFIRVDPQKVDLREAEIVVSGGRGVGSREGFRMIEDLAAALGGSVAGTRPAVDAGWIPYERQIGQTGKTVAPKLYLACGISGAIHHNIGMKDSRVILAINKDRHAPIFRFADLGIIGNLHEILPELTMQVHIAYKAVTNHVEGGSHDGFSTE